MMDAEDFDKFRCTYCGKEVGDLPHGECWCEERNKKHWGQSSRFVKMSNVEKTIEEITKLVEIAEAYASNGWKTDVSPSRDGLPTLTILWPIPKLSSVNLAKRRIRGWTRRGLKKL